MSTTESSDIGLYCARCGRRYNRESIDGGRCTRCTTTICSLGPEGAAQTEEKEMRESLLHGWQQLSPSLRAALLRKLYRLMEEV